MNSAEQPKIKRHTVSDLDGTQQGGLAFVIATLGGMIAAAVLAPGALTSFWVWCALLACAVSIGVGVQRLFVWPEQDDAA